MMKEEGKMNTKRIISDLDTKTDNGIAHFHYALSLNRR